MKENNVELISACGLFCAECRRYKKGGCPGCRGNERATWCKIRTCCMNHGYESCADCEMFEDQSECKIFYNFISKFFEFVFRSDRNACIEMIKDKGYRGYAEYMSENGLQTIKR